MLSVCDPLGHASGAIEVRRMTGSSTTPFSISDDTSGLPIVRFRLPKHGGTLFSQLEIEGDLTPPPENKYSPIRSSSPKTTLQFQFDSSRKLIYVNWGADHLVSGFPVLYHGVYVPAHVFIDHARDIELSDGLDRTVILHQIASRVDSTIPVLPYHDWSSAATCPSRNFQGRVRRQALKVDNVSARHVYMPSVCQLQVRDFQAARVRPSIELEIQTKQSHLHLWQRELSPDALLTTMHPVNPQSEHNPNTIEQMAEQASGSLKIDASVNETGAQDDDTRLNWVRAVDLNLSASNDWRSGAMLDEEHIVVLQVRCVFVKFHSRKQQIFIGPYLPLGTLEI